MGVTEAKRRLPELLTRVAHGERFTITRRGKPIAVLEAASMRTPGGRAAAGVALKEFARGHSRGDFDIRAAIEEGRA